MLTGPLHYDKIQLFVRYIQYLLENNEIASFQETPICIKSVQKSCHHQ